MLLMVTELVQPWLLREEEDGCGGDCGNGAGTVGSEKMEIAGAVYLLFRSGARWCRDEARP